MDWKIRANLLHELKVKMRRSGYNTGLMNVKESGLTGYYNMVSIELQGGRRVNQTQETGRDLMERNKVTGKSTWHLRRNGSSKPVEVGIWPNNT